MAEALVGRYDQDQHPPVFLKKVKCVHSFSAKLKDDKTGPLNISGLALTENHLFTVDGKKLFSTEKINRTKVFTHAGEFEFDIILNNPVDVAVSHTGHLYITTPDDKCVKVYSTRGQHLTTIGQGHLGEPCGITLNRQGHVMVCDNKKKSVFSFHADSGQLLNTVPLSMCKFPDYITVNRVDDNIVISDLGGHCARVLSPTGGQLYQYGTQGSGDGQLRLPCGVCTDSYGHIFIADYYNHRIVALSPRGQFIRYIATSHDGLWFPTALAINPAGKLVAAEKWGNVKTFQYLQ